MRGLRPAQVVRDPRLERRVGLAQVALEQHILRGNGRVGLEFEHPMAIPALFREQRAGRALHAGVDCRKGDVTRIDVDQRIDDRRPARGPRRPQCRMLRATHYPRHRAVKRRASNTLVSMRGAVRQSRARFRQSSPEVYSEPANLAASGAASGAHSTRSCAHHTHYRRFGAGRCARPFHMPPLPRQCCTAESSVNARYAPAMAGIATPHHRDTP